MVAAAGRPGPGPGAGPLLITAAAAVLVAVTLHAGAARSGLTAWLQGLLSCSDRYPLPEDAPADVGVVLGYALHRWVGVGALHDLRCRLDH